MSSKPLFIDKQNYPNLNSFFPRLQGYWHDMLGNRDAFTLQSRIYHFACIATIVVMLYVLIFSIAVGMRPYALITTALIPLQVSLYYLSRVKRRTALSSSIYSLLFHCFFVVSYRLTSGITGSTLLSFCLVYFLSLAIASRRQYAILTLVNLGFVGTLLVLEYNDPAFILGDYTDRKEHFIDIASTYTVNIVLFLIGLGFIIRNYSKEKERAEERAMMLDELNEEKARLISVISHDYHTPLVSLKKYLDIIENYDITPDERRMLESEIRQSIVNTQNLLMNLLDMTKSDIQRSGLSRYFDIQDAIGNTLHVYSDIARAKGQQFNISLPEDLRLRGNPHLFTIVIRNLINNAVKFSKAGSTINLTYELQQGRLHVFCIADSGPGIPEAAQREIIESWKNPSRNTSRSGGLGLALSKKYTEAFGGELTFITSEGHGTSFYVKIPLA